MSINNTIKILKSKINIGSEKEDIENYFYRNLTEFLRNKQFEDFKKIVEKIKYKCPKCGTEFNSIPVYCYSCLKELETNENFHEQ